MWQLFIQRQKSGNILRFTIRNNPFYSIGSPELSRIASFYFPANCVVHFQGIAYDQYSIDELGQTRPGLQWLTFPLPHELGRADYPKPWQPPVSKKSDFPLRPSPPTRSTLAFLQQIYVITDESFTDRHEHLKRVFLRHEIPVDAIQWQFNWNRTTCNLNESREEVRKILNLKPGKNGNAQTLLFSFDRSIKDN